MAEKRTIHMGGKSIMELAMSQREAEGNTSVKLPFKAKGWKSSKMPAGATKKDIEKGEISDVQVEKIIEPKKGLVKQIKDKIKPKEEDN